MCKLNPVGWASVQDENQSFFYENEKSILDDIPPYGKEMEENDSVFKTSGA